MEKEESFITLIAQEEAIWNPQHPDHLRKPLINKKWGEIADQLGVNSK